MEKGFHVDESLFENDSERNLYTAATSAISANYESLEARLDTLFALKAPLDTFFDNVMVNAEDLAVRANRKALVGMIYAEIYSIADIKNITL
jgi:glycyl-tRNA synthetase beta chain